jgi:hypothetical protein
VQYAQLVEQCVRSEHFQARDAPLAAAMLQQLGAAVIRQPDCGHLLSQPDDCSVLVSAVASYMKWAGYCITSAGEAQAESQQHSGNSATPDLAMRCFPAAVPALIGMLLAPTGEALCLAAQQQQQQQQQEQHHVAGFTTAAASSISDGSSSSSAQVGSSVEQQQCRASAVLLTVLLARSLVVLTDAMEAAAAAAGSTPAQLFVR